MNGIHNFSAGPAALPKAVLEKAQAELLNWQGHGYSVMEMSHRSAEFVELAKLCEARLRRLMSIPDNYKVLFLQGGASAQFGMVPINLLPVALQKGKSKIGIVNTGHWSKKAIKEAKRFAPVHIVASSESDQFHHVPKFSSWDLPEDLAYVHITPNETIGGLQYHWLPELDKLPQDTPIVADMSSCILSEPLDVSRFGLIYAGAQKNIGPAGITLVIVRDDLLNESLETVPTVMNYALQSQADSMQNTPPTFAWYLASLVFEWLEQQGGVQAMAALNHRKAQKLYQCIDDSDFYSNPIAKQDRSIMNIPFILKNAQLDAEFLQQASVQGLLFLKGHRAVGGMRASLYNAVPEASVDALVAFMQSFSASHSG